MADKTYSLGSKNPKKEITIDVKGKHYLYFFLVLFLIVGIVTILTNKYFGEVQNLELKCNDGSKEQIQFEKQFYCGVHYSTLKGLLSDKQYNLIDRQINFGDVYDE